jgi:hypothetical protein
MRPLDVAAIQHFKTYYAEEIGSWLITQPRRAVTGYHDASVLGKAHLKAAAAEVAVRRLHKTSLFPVKRNSFKQHEFIVGDLPQLDLSNSQKSFVLPFDIGPVPTRRIHRNTSLSPRQGTAVLATGPPHKQILIKGSKRGYKTMGGRR